MCLPIHRSHLAVHRVQQGDAPLDLVWCRPWWRWHRLWGKSEPRKDILQRKRLLPLLRIAVHIAQELEEHPHGQHRPLLPLPVRLGEQMGLAKGQTPKFVLAQAEAGALKAPELLPVQPSKGPVSLVPSCALACPCGVCTCQASTMAAARGKSAAGSL